MENRILALLLVGGLFGGAMVAGANELDRYNVVWNSPSRNAHGSMPLGNGDIGINAWVEPSGDLVFYISKTDAWDENGRLCKAFSGVCLEAEGYPNACNADGFGSILTKPGELQTHVTTYAFSHRGGE